MARIATEALTGGSARISERPKPMLVRFFAFDGSARVVVDADNEDDARYLCGEMRWDFICLCDS